MLQELPVECLAQIIGHLPTASAVINLSVTCQRLHVLIAKDDYAIFRTFVQRSFPSITTGSGWKDLAIRLTSRSRAWDRSAVLVRECRPGKVVSGKWQDWLSDTARGLQPVLDSYDTNPSDSRCIGEEVLAFTSAGRILIRSSTAKQVQWSRCATQDDQNSNADITHLRLLRPYQRHDRGETMFVARRDGTVSRMSMKNNSPSAESSLLFAAASNARIDVSMASKPMLAVCNAEKINIFDANAPANETLQVSQTVSLSHADSVGITSIKFLSDRTVTTTEWSAKQNSPSYIRVYDLNYSASESSNIWSITHGNVRSTGTSPNLHANVITPLDHVCGGRGQLFLTGWNDGSVVLSDIRMSENAAIFTDPVDDGQIYSIAAIGHESFVAGGSQDACLKTFDMRMPGMRPYSYLETSSQSSRPISTPSPPRSKHPTSKTKRDINIFLSVNHDRYRGQWQPLTMKARKSWQRYRGSIYSLSIPSPTSTRVYAGITEHVLELDIVSTDDLRRRIPVDPLIEADLWSDRREVLNVACYERPRPGYEATDVLSLHKQEAWRNVMPHNNDDEHSSPGQRVWDERWRLGGNEGSRTRGRW